MPLAHERPVYAYRRAAEQDAVRPVRHLVAIVGAGPVGLAAAIDCAVHGLPSVLLDAEDTVCDGSKAICFAKRTLEIFDRLGCGERLVNKGIVWNLGRVFFGERQVYEFDLAPEAGYQRPAFINLQQYYLEEYLIERLCELGADLRWRNTVTAVEPYAEGVGLTVETPDGPYRVLCDYLIVADGARSPIRHLLGLSCQGQVFQDHFLIADVVMQADFPTERWFWFKPPFHTGQSALLHRQADNVWRIDFQLGCDADPDEEKRPERVIARIKAMLGENIRFDLKWVSVYTFQCRRMERFRHGSWIFFAGDAAHQVSPFGARGANGGIQDVDNLIWKLALVALGKAPAALLESYDTERILAADENILNSSRSTDFITPKGEASRAFRDATLMLAEHYPFARRLVNSGRLSVPAVLHGSPLSTPDAEAFDSALSPGAPCVDAPIETATGRDWLLHQLGNRFTGLYFTDASGEVPARAAEIIRRLATGAVPVDVLVVGARSGCGIVDVEGLVQRRYGGCPGMFYLIRPDQHVCARWRRLEHEPVRRALERAVGRVTRRSEKIA